MANMMPVQELLKRDESPAHQREHRSREIYIAQCIEAYRSSLGVDHDWSIECRVMCPVDMPEHEGSIWWDENCWYARLMVRCDLPLELVKWIIEHMEQLFRAARDQGIEQRVRLFLGQPRPYHLVIDESQLLLTEGQSQDQGEEKE